MVLLKLRDVVVDQLGLTDLRDEYQRRNCVLLPKLLDDSLLSVLAPLISQDTWQSFTHAEGIGTESVLDQQARATTALHFAVNSPQFLNAVRFITGCHQLTWFAGRVFSMQPDAGHAIGWHNDVMPNRFVGMSINLSQAGYDGGVFELTDVATKTQNATIANTQLGGASLFRISEDLHHRVSPITGNRPRVAFAGWFYSGEPQVMGFMHRVKELTGED